jgi:polysaccharide deacetylase family protein (PEP-CTERM system associated)
MRSGPSNSAPIRAALTIDLEDWYQGLELPVSAWERCESRLAVGITRLLGLFADAGVRATFFVLGPEAERHPELIREIARAGHELATHGWSHEFVYRLTPEVFREELKRSVRVIEDLSGRPVLGHRAPFFSITQQSLWALEILAEQGLRYDSSIFPVRNYRYGIPDAPRWPHAIPTAIGPIQEFPLTTVRRFGTNVPVAGGAYFRIYPYWFTRWALRSAAAQGGGQPLAFYLHPWELDPDHPRIPLPRRIALTHYFKLRATEGRLRRLLRDFRFGPMGEVLGVA